MDVYQASANMIAFSEFMVAAAKSTYGEQVEARAEVAGFGRGSFITDLVFNFAGQAATIFAAVSPEQLLTVVNQAFELWKHLKGEQPKAYQTPYGEVIVNRHVYQRSCGGKTYCPLERDGRIIMTSTPFFAKQVSSKLAYGSAREVQRDLSENHARPVAVSYIQRVSEAVASIIEAKEEEWEYVPPELNALISRVAIGLDGTCMLMMREPDGEKPWWERLASMTP